jgi:hypothetical protein
LGTLIDYKRAADGVAYGIIKENHHYYIKKAGLKQDPDVADFAYIGGLANITEYQYKSFAEADKNRNMLLATINESLSGKLNKNGTKLLKEDKEDIAGQEIDQAANKVADLDAATEKAATADATGDAEMAAGLDAEPTAGEEVPAEPAPESGEDNEEPAPEGGNEEIPEDEPESDDTADATSPEDEKSLTVKEIEKTLGKLTNKIRKTDLEPSEIKSYVNSFLASFKDKFGKVEIEDRKAMADKILKVVPDNEIKDLEQNVGASEEAAGIEEEGVCAECSGFDRYAESRGYTKESIMNCDEEEMCSLVSGYANAYNDGQNDGDFKLVALFVSPQMLKILKGDYGHDEYVEKLTPYVNQVSETTEEDKMAQINELWGGLGALGKAAWSGVKKAGQAVGQAAQAGAQKVGQAYQAGKEKIGQAATAIKQTYHAGEVPGEIKKLENIAADLGKQIAALNTRLQKAGQQPVNIKSILATIQNQVAAKGTASLGKYGIAAEDTDPANVDVQPNMLKEMDELEGEEGKEEFDFAADADVLGTGVVKPDGAKVEIEEPETDGTGEKEFEIKDSTVNITVNENHGLAMKGTGTPKGKGKPFIEEEKPSAGLSKEKRSEIVKAAKKGKDIGKKGKNFEKVKKAAEKSGATNPEAVAAAAMWRNIKRESEEEKPAMSESEVRLRKYIRARLQEKVGLRKAVLNESEKSPTIKKLDAMIDKQFELYESLNEGFGEKIAGMVNKLNQRMEGKFGKQKELKAIVDANPESSRSALKKAYSSEIMNTGGLGIMIDRAPLEDVIDVAKQAANDPNGLGKISSRAGKLIYIPANET